jgi:sugar phosphate isomerase/epimerase
MASVLKDFSRLCLHTMTTRPWSIEDCINNYAKAGIHGITIWRNVIENKDLAVVRTRLNDHSMEVISLCRGGFFPSVNPGKRQTAIDDNLLAIEQASTLGAPLIVLVCGADKEQPLERSRDQIMEGIVRILPEAESAGIRLAIEPLHPMYAGDRSAVNTIRQANEMAEKINSPLVGVAVDVYHLWWDPDLEEGIKRCAANRHFFAFHVCDWKVPTVDFLNDRGIMGEGCIDIRRIRSWVEETGFGGYNEVEIFSDIHWAENQHKYLHRIKQAYLNHT